MLRGSDIKQTHDLLQNIHHQSMLPDFVRVSFENPFIEKLEDISNNLVYSQIRSLFYCYLQSISHVKKLPSDDKKDSLPSSYRTRAPAISFKKPKAMLDGYDN